MMWLFPLFELPIWFFPMVIGGHSICSADGLMGGEE